VAEITAAAVKKLRDRTSLPMMECKAALQQTGGDEEAAVEYLRKAGKTKMGAREAERVTAEGRIAAYASVDAGVGAMIEVLCESAPVANNEAFKHFVNDMAMQLAKGPAVADAEALLDQPSPSNPAQKLRDVRDDLTNQMREVLRIPRLLRIDAPCGSYIHHIGNIGVLLEVEGTNQQVANEIAMHVAAMKPLVVSRESLDVDGIENEKRVQREIALAEGKPANIVEKMIEGRMRLYYQERCLVDQFFVKDESGKTTVEQAAKAAGLKIKRFELWQIGKAEDAAE
jgi:elongation factor Ts